MFGSTHRQVVSVLISIHKPATPWVSCPEPVERAPRRQLADQLRKFLVVVVV
jgi:uncharacterized protein (UPF0548 family)